MVARPALVPVLLFALGTLIAAPAAALQLVPLDLAAGTVSIELLDRSQGCCTYPVVQSDSGVGSASIPGVTASVAGNTATVVFSNFTRTFRDSLQIIGTLTGIVPGPPGSLEPVVVVPVFDDVDFQFTLEDPTLPPNPALRAFLGAFTTATGEVGGEAIGSGHHSGDVSMTADGIRESQPLRSTMAPIAGDLVTFTVFFGSSFDPDPCCAPPGTSPAASVVMNGSASISFFSVAVPGPAAGPLLALGLGALALRPRQSR